MSTQDSNVLASSTLSGSNAAYIEALYEDYLKDPQSIDPHWRQYFEQMGTTQLHEGSGASGTAEKTELPMSGIAERLIQAYRSNGVLRADIDPLKLNLSRPCDVPELDTAYYGLSDQDLLAQVDTSSTYFGQKTMRLDELLGALQQTYSGTLAVEYTYIRDAAVREWWAQKMESSRAHIQLVPEQKKRVLERLTAAEGFEGYLNTKYVGVKRFSLDGGDPFIVAMDELIQHAAGYGVDEVVIGMAHRGRLNTLVNLLGMPPHDLFAAFDGTAPEPLSAGDVKYHMGYANNLKTAHGTVHVSLGYNPSHLEVVSAVQSGSARARIDRRGKQCRSNVLAVTVHGDGAVIGQGIVQEMFSLAKTRGYDVGGAIRIVINNQVQFTTSDLRDVRSSIYCTDIARMTDMPVLHVNCDDPEAVVHAMQLAVEFRQTFQLDVMLDLICYRKLGHNEQDTPQITQPFMYKAIKEHPGTRHLYAQRLLDEGLLVAGEEQQMVEAYRDALERNDIVSHLIDPSHEYPYTNNWAPYQEAPWSPPIDTSVPEKTLKKYAKGITTVPPSVHVHPLVQRVLNDRLAMGKGEIPVDWGMAENLAYASLVDAEIPVRISGEDCGRGTFSHRQCIVHNQDRKNRLEDSYIPLEHISKKQAPFMAIDSVLSENAVLAFEYGYSISRPNGLTLWEAQFGDFANGAQIVIDQFISSGECKWGQHSGVVLLLPHGYEGQGPEHSSARIERFLELSAEENWVLAQPTNAAQIFHLLRLQALAPYRKPLVIFSPKSLLRHKGASVPLQALTTGQFQMVIPEADQSVVAKNVTRVLACSGRLYYDLVAEREKLGAEHIAIIRVEQLYPFPEKELLNELKKYKQAKEVFWCQDEPANQGARGFAERKLMKILPKGVTLKMVARPESPAPATGYAKKHQEQLKALLQQAFGRS